MEANNLSNIERDSGLWNWIKDFPKALYQVLCDSDFQVYLNWEKEWVKQQTLKYTEDLGTIQSYLNTCTKLYLSPINETSIVINPIKCAYSADYHINGNNFIFSSGAFSKDSIIHEFLHHVIHDTIVSHCEAIIHTKSDYPEIDCSYYLSHGETGELNAFEEYTVRRLTDLIILNKPPQNLNEFVEELLSNL